MSLAFQVFAYPTAFVIFAWAVWDWRDELRSLKRRDALRAEEEAMLTPDDASHSDL